MTEFVLALDLITAFNFQRSINNYVGNKREVLAQISDGAPQLPSFISRQLPDKLKNEQKNTGII